MKKRKSVLILGGARSGKSRFAQELAQRWGGNVLFVATAEAGDNDMRQRIEKHRQNRPSDWRTLETTRDIGVCIEKECGRAGTVLVDCITLLVSNIFNRYSEADLEKTEEQELEVQVLAEITALVEIIARTPADFIIVSNELGLGLVPSNRMGRLYRDLLGRANQVLAQYADEVYLMVAGIPLMIKSQIDNKISKKHINTR
jgi:adenosylcobinamide kinase/adenosylcobinamide-phosphate guanylyltransferase